MLLMLEVLNVMKVIKVLKVLEMLEILNLARKLWRLMFDSDFGGNKACNRKTGPPYNLR